MLTERESLPYDLRASIRILIIDDERTLREGCATALRVDGFTVATSSRGSEALEMLVRSRFDIVFCDLHLDGTSGLEILKATRAARRNTIFILMTGRPSLASSLEAMEAGAWEYLAKPFTATQFQLVVGRAAHTVLARRTHVTADDEIGPAPDASDETLLGTAPSFVRALDLARKVASTNASVLLTGESGTGKEMFAHFIHRHSRRNDAVLVPLNCAALPENLLESEMFGHRRGAFTGADRDKVGLLEFADGGTMFLDELTEMPLPLQAKLLRVVQDGVVRRVGSEQPDATVDVRYISATNRDPREAVRGRQLREDLYYRLNVVSIALPALRERREDIPLLAAHFLRRFWVRHHRPSDPMPRLSDDALRFLQGRQWRGNVRELQNVVEHLVVMTAPGTVIEAAELPLHHEGELFADAKLDAEVRLAGAYHIAKDEVVNNFERAFVTRLVASTHGNMARAAREASIDRTTLYRLLERHGVQRHDGRI